MIFPSLRQTTSRIVVFSIIIIVGMTLLRGSFAALADLRVDEAYYWTWSKERVFSYLDHPPMIAWAIRLGTSLFGDTNFGVRFSGLLAMLVMQVLLADIVWQTVRDIRYAVVAALLPEATFDYGLMMSKVTPDTAMIPFALAMVWSLVRMARSGNLTWWLAAGLFGGLALLSKYTAVLLIPGILAFALLPEWRWRHLASPCFWLAPVIALIVMSPVIYWNVLHDWISFRFQLDRGLHTTSARFLGDFIGSHFVLIGPLVLPVVVAGTAMAGWRGVRSRDPVTILLATSGLFPLGLFLLLSFSMRIGDSWSLLAWPFCFAAAAINLYHLRGTTRRSWVATTAAPLAAAGIVTGIAGVIALTVYYLASPLNLARNDDPIGKEAGFADVVAAADRMRAAIGASWFATTDYRVYSMLRWHLKDRVPVIQINERNRFIDFKPVDPRRLGPVALYIASRDKPELWPAQARREPIGSIPLIWRGFVYDTYATQKLTNFTPVLSPTPGDPLFVGAPH